MGGVWIRHWIRGGRRLTVSTVRRCWRRLLTVVRTVVGITSGIARRHAVARLAIPARRVTVTWKTSQFTHWLSIIRYITQYFTITGPLGYCHKTFVNKSVEIDEILQELYSTCGTSRTIQISYYTFKTTSINMCKTLPDKNQLHQTDK